MNLANDVTKLNLASYVQKQKLIWRSTRRAMLEVDMYFSQFIRQVGLDGLTEEELSAYNTLVEFEDGYLMSLFQGKMQIENVVVQHMIEKIRFYARDYL